jgi:hypothetical protein
MGFYTKSQHIFRLYFDSIHISFQFPVSKFLNIIQAIESYHTERDVTELISQKKQEFQERKKEAVKIIKRENHELGDWTNAEFKYITPLRLRLEELCNESNFIFNAFIPNKEYFIGKVMDSRNYYTHYDPKKKLKAASDIELEVMTGALRMLIGLNILVECGVSKEKLKKLILENAYFKVLKRSIEENNLWRN